MGLPDLIRRALATAEAVAGPLRATVLHTPLTGRGTYGPTYGTPVDRLFLVEAVGQVVASADGTQHVSSSKFTALDPFPMSEGDRLTLNGVTATVIKVGGLLDPDGQPYAPQAWTGKP
jgi:hypothetical protein